MSSLTKTVNRLKQKRAEAIAESRRVLEGAEAEDRQMTETERAKFAELHDAEQELRRDIDTYQSQIDAESSVGTFKPDGGDNRVQAFTEDEMFRAFLRGFDGTDAELTKAAAELGFGKTFTGKADDGSDSPIQLKDSREHRRHQALHRAARKARMSAEELREYRDQSADPANTGKGPELIPTEFATIFEDRLLEFGNVMAISQVLRTSTGRPLEIPKGDNITKGVMVAESTDPAVADLAFLQAALGAWKFSSQRIMIPTELIEDSAIDVVGYAADKAGERIARIENEKFTIGVGTTEPEGVVTGSTDSGVTPGAIDDVALLSLVHSLDPAYRRLGARFMMNDQSLLTVKQLKDLDGRYLWMPNMIGSEPDTIHGYAYEINQDMPDHTAGGKGVLFGAFQKFLVRSVRGVRMQVLRERYAELDQVAVLAFHRADSLVIQPEAIRYYEAAP